MLDYRIYTFLKLCDLMNYSATAKALNMTQPAVTQHIQYLEQKYHCKLFTYNGKNLSKTETASILEQYARSANYNELNLRRELNSPSQIDIRIGATKTIGDYVIDKQIVDIMHRSDVELLLVVDNTERLLNMLNHTKIDIALIEGFFDKHKYGYKLLKPERFVGICSKDHPFAGKQVSMKDLFSETIIFREQGSGTRAICEQILLEHNYTPDCFIRTAYVSSFELIKKLVFNNCGISFVYEAVAQSDKSLGIFTINNVEVQREFNYVYLKNTSADKLISLFE